MCLGYSLTLLQDKMDTSKPVSIRVRARYAHSELELCLRSSGICSGLSAKNQSRTLYRRGRIEQQELPLRLDGSKSILQKRSTIPRKARILPSLPKRLQRRNRVLPRTPLARRELPRRTNKEEEKQKMGRILPTN